MAGGMAFRKDREECGRSFLSLIAERTGVNPKQVHKVLVSYRLGLFRGRWI